MHYIYRATSPSGKSYIGVSNRIVKRIKRHIADVKKGSNFAFHCAIRKYGWDAFTLEILEYADDKEQVYKSEIYWIAHFGTYKNSYNMTIGGDCGPDQTGFKQGPMSEEQRQIRSDTLKGIKRGPWSKERKLAKSKSMKGKKATQEARRNMAIAQKKRRAKIKEQV